MRDFTVRIATLKDVRAINKFATPVVKELKFYNKEHMAKNLYEVSVKDLKATIKENKDSIIVATTKEGRIVGMCMHFVGHGHVDWMDWGLVDKDFRRMGIRKAMLKFEIKEAKRLGCHKVWCNTYPKNKPAIKFFTRMGFRKVGILRKHAFKQDEILWEKIIG